MESPSNDVSPFFAEATDEGFDFQRFCSSMKTCISENLSTAEDVELNFYLLAYAQLYNFFVILGGAFQFVAQDVKSKIKILRTYLDEERAQSKCTSHFSTVKSMVNYEMEAELLRSSKYVSGSRTLLRLHRGLDFIRHFLSELYQLEDNTRLGTVAREIYDKTLANYHSWVVRNTARVAMQFLPTRIELFNKISQYDEQRLHCILELFPDALLTVNIVYDRIQCIYTQNNLLDLP